MLVVELIPCQNDSPYNTEKSTVLWLRLKGIFTKQNIPHGVLNVVSNCDSSSIGKVQKPELASIFDTFCHLADRR